MATAKQVRGKRVLVGLAVMCTLILVRCGGPRYPVQGISRSSKPYCVRGKWYTPQQHYDYDEIGLASWYGPGFHGSPKAQGEIYNQYAMTAAHKTLPLPTIAKVTNLANGRSVIVLIDDRGPYEYKGRIIDLSVSAAKELGIHKHGVVKVRVQALPHESHALSMHLKHHGTPSGRDKKGRSWEEVYRQEVGCKREFKDLTPVSMEVHRSNCREMLSRPNKPNKKPSPASKPAKTTKAREPQKKKLPAKNLKRQMKPIL